MKSSNHQTTLLVGALLVAAAVAALFVGRDDAPPVAAPDVVAPPSTPAEVAYADEALPPGHPPIDAAPTGDVLPAGHPPIDGQHAASAGMGADLAPIEKLEGGMSVAEIYAGAAKLEGQRVRIRARVVKSMPNIMGRTWLHVQDGTGDSAKGDHDLVVTTTAEPTIGQTVVLDGLLVRNKDLGSGYHYDVLLEDARVDDSAGSGG